MKKLSSFETHHIYVVLSMRQEQHSIMNFVNLPDSAIKLCYFLNNNSWKCFIWKKKKNWKLKSNTMLLLKQVENWKKEKIGLHEAIVIGVQSNNGNCVYWVIGQHHVDII